MKFIIDSLIKPITIIVLALSFIQPFSLATADSSYPPELVALWQEGLSQVSNEKYDEALATFTEWEKEAGSLGITSADLSYNLGLVYLHLKKPAPAVYSLLLGANLMNSPWRIWKILLQVDQVQKELGAKDSVIKSARVWLSFLFNSNWIFFFAAASFWCFIAALVIHWWNRQSSKYTWVLWSVGLTLTVTTSLGYLNRKLSPKTAVLLSNTAIHASKRLTKESLLIELPEGFIVTVSHESDRAIKIEAPLIGWADSEEIKIIN